MRPLEPRHVLPAALIGALVFAGPALPAHDDDHGGSPHPDHDPRTAVEDFHRDPLRQGGSPGDDHDRGGKGHGDHDGDDNAADGPKFHLRGGGNAFDFQQGSPRHFAGDRGGSLEVTVNANAKTARYFTDLGGGYTQDDDFVFGAALTIRPQRFAADPDSSASIAFGLFDGKTTGYNRTGDTRGLGSDSFNTVEVAYFPSASKHFGGPFLCPTILGEKTSDDAVDNIAFNCAEIELKLGAPYYVHVTHSAGQQTLTAHIWQLDPTAAPVLVGQVVTGTDVVSGFHVDRLAINAYRDGYGQLAPTGASLFAISDWDLLLAGPSTADAEVQEALARLKVPE